MLAKIHKIKRLGLVFADFSWTPGLGGFKSVNLIYGWNGCGKTTLTRFFDILYGEDNGGIEFEVEDGEGAKFVDASAFSTPLRIFNQDYIQKNVRTVESSANAIAILLGEKNRELVAEIETDERSLHGEPGNEKLIGKIRENQISYETKSRLEKDSEKLFTTIAREIGLAIVGSDGASRTYRSPDAKIDFAMIKTPTLFSDEDLDARIQSLKQELKPEFETVSLPSIMVDDSERPFMELFSECLQEGRELCASTVEAEVIVRLRDNPDISDWVEHGRRIHAEHKSGQCEYCGNVISEERISQLARYFNESDQMLKARIDELVARLRELYEAVERLTVHDSALLYSELRIEYEKAADALKSAKAELIADIMEVRKVLQDKKNLTAEKIKFGVIVDASGFLEAISALNAALNNHNTKSQEFQKVKEQTVDEIKTHYLSTIFEDITWRSAEIEKLQFDFDHRSQEINEIRARIADARAKISSAHKACETINENLRTFLGRQELRFEPDRQRVDDGKGGQSETVVGYKIMRGDQPALYLSESEKTAIAFVYFVVHLNDGQFAKKDGIVVIDDPISSLDSNSLYQAFSFLKSAVKDSGQVFILTHHFGFLKLLLNWRKRLSGTGYYMIRNHFPGPERRATIEKMDNELKKYDSEYQYLFKLLKEMKANQDGSIMQAYPVPNIARKVWDTFLIYRVPNSDSVYKKMDQLKADGLDAQKLDAVYKFINDQSHITGTGFDPALVPETQKVLGELFEMMKEIAPAHFEVLDKATPIDNAMA